MACSFPRCPGYAVFRGRCAQHAQTTTQRGYGASWQATRAVVRHQERECRECGATSDLTVDHIRPQSMGGTNARDNLRVLCRPCHSRIGVRWVSR